MLLMSGFVSVHAANYASPLSPDGYQTAFEKKQLGHARVLAALSPLLLMTRPSFAGFFDQEHWNWNDRQEEPVACL